MSIQVTVTDEQTGDTNTCWLDDDPKPGNYVLTCGPGTVLAHHQTYANGTEVLTIKAADDDTERPMIGEWRTTDTGTCSRAHCREPAVAMINRGQHRGAGHTIDAWWRYCHTHLADYGRHVDADHVRWRSDAIPHARVETVDTGGLL